MKNCITIVCLWLCLSAAGKDTLPLFGEIDRADLLMKSCSFDPDAAAVYLIDEGESVIYTSFEVVMERRIRIKILKESGIDRASIKIPYYSKDQYQQLDNVKGYTYNLDETDNVEATPLESKLIFDKKVDQQFSEVSFAFPGIKVGSVIEYKYRLIKHRGVVDIDDWYFQRDDAVRYSSYHTVIPNSLIFTLQVVNRQPVEASKPVHEGDGYTFVMKNIPGLRYEPYTAGLKDYFQRVDFQLSGYMETGGFKHSYVTTWQALTEKVLDDEFFGFQLRKNIPADDLKAKLASVSSSKERIEKIYTYVQQNMDWDGYYRKYSEDGIKKAWEKRSGSTGDINLILLNLLQEAGVTAYPCLVSTRDHGKINTAYPFLDQFNATYVYAVADGAPYILNAADKYNPPDLIPEDVQFTQGFVVAKKGGGFVSLNSYEKKYMQISNMSLQVTENGSFIGNGIITCFDYAKLNNRSRLTASQLQQRFSDNPSIQMALDSVTITGDKDAISPLDANLAFNGVLQQSGNYTFLPYNLFSGFGQSPFVATNRQTDIDFGYTQQYIISGSYALPANYELEELPKNITMMMPDTSIIVKRITQKEGNTIQYKITLDCGRPQYTVEEYPAIKEFYLKLYAILNEQIVIKKKT